MREDPTQGAKPRRAKVLKSEGPVGRGRGGFGLLSLTSGCSTSVQSSSCLTFMSSSSSLSISSSFFAARRVCRHVIFVEVHVLDPRPAGWGRILAWWGAVMRGRCCDFHLTSHWRQKYLFVVECVLPRSRYQESTSVVVRRRAENNARAPLQLLFALPCEPLTRDFRGSRASASAGKSAGKSKLTRLSLTRSHMEMTTLSAVAVVPSYMEV